MCMHADCPLKSCGQKHSSGPQATQVTSHMLGASAWQRGRALVLFADHLADARLPLALLVARDAAVLAAGLLKALALPPQRLHHLLLCHLRTHMHFVQHLGSCHRVEMQDVLLGRAFSCPAPSCCKFVLMHGISLNCKPFTDSVTSLCEAHIRSLRGRVHRMHCPVSSVSLQWSCMGGTDESALTSLNCSISCS